HALAVGAQIAMLPSHALDIRTGAKRTSGAGDDDRAHRVVDDNRLMSEAEALATDLAEAPTFALGLAKKLFNAAAGPSLEQYLEIESLVQPQLHHTADNAEGVAAFREKRPAKFIGR
ncbi:MAG: enoyl-CoA hydratase-related protein, partial [Stellaceae bacterium]